VSRRYDGRTSEAGPSEPPGRRADIRGGAKENHAGPIEARRKLRCSPILQQRAQRRNERTTTGGVFEPKWPVEVRPSSQPEAKAHG